MPTQNFNPYKRDNLPQITHDLQVSFLIFVPVWDNYLCPLLGCDISGNQHIYSRNKVAQSHLIYVPGTSRGNRYTRKQLQHDQLICHYMPLEED